MKQLPSRYFFKKPHKPASFFLKAAAQKAFFPLTEFYGLKSLAAGRLTFKQIEAGRRTIRRTVSKRGKLVIRTFTGVSITKRSMGLRMGKGKGSHDRWVCPVRRGQILYELSGVPTIYARFALRKAADKMPFRCSVVKLIY
jgi:large subunit ribosomal protein L16